MRAVALGDTYLQPSAARALAKGGRRHAEHADERDVLRLVARGYSAPEIGEQLFISPQTVDTYKQRIGGKLGLLQD